MFLNAPANKVALLNATLETDPPSKGQHEVEADGLRASASAPAQLTLPGAMSQHSLLE